MSMISELVKELRRIADYEYQNRNSEATIRKAADTIEMLSEKARIVDTSQTDKTCDNCGTPRDKCVYCVEEDRMWTPQTERRIDRDGDMWEWRGDAWYCIGQADTPQTDCYVSDLCKHYGDKQICGRCRNRNMFCEAEPQLRCPKDNIK